MTSASIASFSKLSILYVNNSALTQLTLSNLPSLSSGSFNGNSQTPAAIPMTADSDAWYSESITLNSPTFGSDKITYEGGKIKSTDSSVTSTTFEATTGKDGMKLSGTLPLTYVEGATASIGDVTISGTVGTEIGTQTATITLVGDTVKAGGYTEADASTWFADAIPTGLEVSASGTTGTDKIMLSFTGTPGVATTSSIGALMIPKEALTGGVAIEAPANSKAKFNIALPTLGGKVGISLNAKTGELTAVTKDVTGADSDFSYAWSGTGVSGSNATYAASGALGKEITLTLTSSEATGSLEAKITVYEVTITKSGGSGTDAVSMADTYGVVGDEIEISCPPH
jgi:flagellar hook assembly protein FlgD